MPKKCPLCKANNPTMKHQGKVMKRMVNFYHCDHCQLLFVSPHQHLNDSLSTAKYLLHRNSLAEKGYRQLLQPVIDWVTTHQETCQPILDFGCGHEPVLTQYLQNNGFLVKGYDKFFYPIDLHNKKYTTIICTEVVEHFTAPLEQWNEMLVHLRPGGTLLVLTELSDGKDLSNWGYLREATHVSFYHSKTLSWIAQKFSLQPLSQNQNFSAFQKPHDLSDPAST